jgi:hypothetical protein
MAYVDDMIVIWNDTSLIEEEKTISVKLSI